MNIIFYIGIIFIGLFVGYGMNSMYNVTRDLGYKFSSGIVMALLMPILMITEFIYLISNELHNFAFNQVCHLGGIDPDEYNEKLNNITDEL